MNELPPHRSPAEEKALFSEIVSELEPQLADPYISGIHKEALLREATVSTVSRGNLDKARIEHIRQLDAKWRYMGMPVTLTGKAWRIMDNLLEPEPRIYIDEIGISRGFCFPFDGEEGPIFSPTRIAHLIEIDSGAGDGSRVPIVAPVDEIIQLEPPLPSPELREQRFAYHFPDDAVMIDELQQTARRDDQVVKGFAEYYFDADLSNDEHVEHLRDGAQYLRSRAQIDPLTTYHIAVRGDVIVINRDGAGIPTRLAHAYSRTMKITDVALRPADITLSELKGRHRCVPFVEAIALEPNGTERELLFPCMSIQWISSSRYDVQKPPQF